MHNNINVNVSGPMQPTSTYKTVVLKGNHSFASQVTEPNMKYVTKHDFDLGGESVTIPEGCLIEFDGGSISNGTLVGNETVLIYNQPFNDIITATLEGTWRHESGVKADEEDITDNNGALKFKDKIYAPAQFSGLGRTYLRKNLQIISEETKNVLTQAMLSADNTIYIIQYDYDLNGEEIVIPENCVLQFDGGSLKNGSISGFISINSNNCKILNNILFLEKIQNEVLDISWFDIDYNNDLTAFLQNLVNYTNKTLKFEKDKTYKISHNIDIIRPIVIDGNNSMVYIEFDSTEHPNDFALDIRNTHDVYVENLKLSSSIQYIVRPTNDIDLNYEYWQKRTQTHDYDCYGIHIFHSYNVDIYKCEISNFGHGILSIASHDYFIHNNYIHNTLFDGIPSYKGCYNAVISGNRIENTDDDSISVVTFTDMSEEEAVVCNNFSIIDNNIKTSYSRGIAIIGGYNVIIRNNVVGDCSISSIEASKEAANRGYVKNIVISSNHINNTISNGIYIQEVEVVKISDNYVNVTTSQKVILGQRSTNLVIEDNFLQNGVLYLNDNNGVNVLRNSLIESKVYVGYSQDVSYENKNYSIQNNIFDNTFDNDSHYVELTWINKVEFNNNVMPDKTGVIDFTNSTGIKVDGQTVKKVKRVDSYTLQIINNSFESFNASYFPFLRSGTILYEENNRFLQIFNKTENKLFIIPYVGYGANEAAALGNSYQPGMSFYDSTNKRVCWWDSSKWVDSRGRNIGNIKGTVANKPANLNSTSDVGFVYFATDLGTNGKPIWWNGTAWVDATGTPV